MRQVGDGTVFEVIVLGFRRKEDEKRDYDMCCYAYFIHLLF